jgi:peptidase E
VIQDWECFDADAGKDSAREIREFYIPDFSNRKNHDSYQQEFQKLLRDLKVEASKTA